MACTTILVGRKASYDGSTMVARNEDSPSGEFHPKKLAVREPQDQGDTYTSVLSKVTIPLPKNPVRYTYMPDAVHGHGLWGAFGVNAYNVSMTATETITSNPRVLAADPLVEYLPADPVKGTPEQVGGIGEEDMVNITLPYIKTAREGVSLLGSYLEKYGTYEMNGIAFQDENEIWWLETIGGHHWMAVRVPDYCYVVMPNQLGIDMFNFDDAEADQEFCMGSKDLRAFVEQNHLDLTYVDEDDDEDEDEDEEDQVFNARLAFGSRTDSDHVYNTPRAWVVNRHLATKELIFEGFMSDFSPEDDDLPWLVIPKRKITVDDIKYVLSNHYQGTPYDVYSKCSDPRMKGKYRAIGINRNNVLGLVQIRPYVPTPLKAIQWIALGSNVFNAMLPLYSQVSEVPAYLGEVGEKPSTDNLYWTSRMIGALADPHFAETASAIERYQNKVDCRSMQYLHDFDKAYIKDVMGIEEVEDSFPTLDPESTKEANIQAEVGTFLAKANQEIVDFVEKETIACLDQVLYTASSLMKNAFSRSDA